jgi:cell division protein FtsB
MGLFRKKETDPISARAEALNRQIARLEAEIEKLSVQSERQRTEPRLRSTARPGGPAAPVAPASPPAVPTVAGPGAEPIFEPVDQHRVKAPPPAADDPARYNDLGLRKYDLAGAWQRLQNHVRGPAPSNPKLVNFLASGSVQGLRPLRYEKRVARNRFLLFAAFLFLVLFGTLAYFLRNH